MRSGWILILGLVGCGFQAGDSTGSDMMPPNADPQEGCAIACHGADTSNAPPKSISGVTATTARPVGAHQAHLVASPAWHRAVECGDCHVVPATVDAPGHIDGDGVAEVAFSERAGGTA